MAYHLLAEQLYAAGHHGVPRVALQGVEVHHAQVAGDLANGLPGQASFSKPPEGGGGAWSQCPQQPIGGGR